MYVDSAGLEALFICLRKGYNMSEMGFAEVLERDSRLTESDKEDMYNLWKGGVTQAEISKIYGKNYSTISRYIEDYCLKNGKPKKNCRNKRRLTLEEKRIAQECYKKYGTLVKVAERLKVNYSWLHRELINEGITYKDLMEGIV